MKKVLLATTALVGFAGAAAAEVTITGSAEMGIVGGDGIETQFWQDVDVTFTLSGESDSGISFGASVDLDEADYVPAVGVNALDNQLDDSGVAVFIKGSFGTLTLGDTDNAVDWAVTEMVGNPGSIADNETIHAGWQGSFEGEAFLALLGLTPFDSDDQRLRYDYSAGNWGVAISYEQFAPAPGGAVAAGSDGTWAIGAKYAFDLGGTTLNLGVGFSSTDLAGVTSFDVAAVSVDAAFGGGFVAGIAYSQYDSGLIGVDADHTLVSVGYASGPFAIGANYGAWDTNIAGIDADGWGLSAAYDFGGGLKAKFGYGSGTAFGATTSVDNWSLGMAMSF